MQFASTRGHVIAQSFPGSPCKPVLRGREDAENMPRRKIGWVDNLLMCQLADTDDEDLLSVSCDKTKRYRQPPVPEKKQ